MFIQRVVDGIIITGEIYYSVVHNTRTLDELKLDGWYEVVKDLEINPEFQKYGEPIINNETKTITYPTVPMTIAETDSYRIQVQMDKINLLRRSADYYEASWISGSSIGMLTSLILSKNPKGLAVQSWINNIWDLYYARKSEVEANWSYVINESYHDIGPIPYSVPELKIELLTDRVAFAKERATELAQRFVVDQMIDTLSDDEVETLTFLYPEWSGESVSLAVNDKVRYNGILYRVLQAHTTQADWTPDTVPALFTRYRDVTAAPQPWVQPQGAHDAYQIDEQVTHNGQTWTSTVADNVWEPGVFGWVVA